MFAKSETSHSDQTIVCVLRHKVTEVSQMTCCDKLVQDDCIAWAESAWAQDDTAEPESAAAKMKQDATSIVAKRLDAVAVSPAADSFRGYPWKKDCHPRWKTYR